MDIDQHLGEIIRLRKLADQLPEDNPAALIDKVFYLAKCLTYIGRLSSHFDGEYKRTYARRKYEQALAEKEAKPPRSANAEIAIKHIRDEESQAYEYMNRWRNAFASTQEEIHALKLKMKIDFADGGADYVRIQSGPQARP
ncbi:hypothetical protein [Paenibacillus sp. P22]|uniref:hypothetical protein n=1 Tax=Paenibacillus sp. P22 TaxID=483908 RepID=UPI000421D691|nr:hypothetical protein [Paenibacillus sp. P22]CDN41683.1 Uncharacterized protein BN871_AJ_00350 [Paenibacillus sp. P22]